MRLRLVLPALALAAMLAPASLGAAPTRPVQTEAAHASAKKKYSIFGSCANGKPFKAARHCHYDKAQLFRATFVFESHVGKRPVKSCFHIYGKKPLSGGACQKLGPLAYKAYPFKVSGIRQKFAVKVTWFVKSKGGGGYKQVGSSFMKVST